MEGKPSFLDLPTEVRQVILQHALKQTGTLEMQTPMWAGHDVFHQPLFAVHSLVRAESLEAFYKVNTFLWMVDRCGTLPRSDPAGYPGMGSQPEWWQPDHEGEVATTCGLTVAVPWLYPDLKKHLRHLQLNIALPSNIAPSTFALDEQELEMTWNEGLSSTLRSVIDALDRGRTLDSLSILFTGSKFFNGRVALTTQQLEVLEVLAEFQVRHRVSISTRLDFKEAGQSVRSLRLEKRMVAQQ